MRAAPQPAVVRNRPFSLSPTRWYPAKRVVITEVRIPATNVWIGIAVNDLGAAK